MFLYININGCSRHKRDRNSYGVGDRPAVFFKTRNSRHFRHFWFENDWEQPTSSGDCSFDIVLIKPRHFERGRGNGSQEKPYNLLKVEFVSRKNVEEAGKNSNTVIWWIKFIGVTIITIFIVGFFRRIRLSCHFKVKY